jgi:hypothetical protein
VPVPSFIICLRHGEKPSTPPDDHGPGLDEHGRQQPHSLTIRGWQRAGGLCATQLCGQVSRQVPIFVPSYDSHTKDHRPYQTVMPLAKRWGSDPHPVGAVTDMTALHDAVMAASPAAVVCWEHANLAQFVSDLVKKQVTWPGGRFDVLWVLRPAPGMGVWQFQQIDQRLLPGDVGV